jgi:8-oxo-dGTP diphosphatase
MRYVAGFLIDPTARTVALVRKNKPEWQAGKLNAIGGKMEIAETPHQAMQREFQEEAGLNITSWDHFATIEGYWGAVIFFRCFNEAVPRTMEEEQIEVYKIDEVPYDQCLPNISWLLPLALYRHDIYFPIFARETGRRG